MILRECEDCGFKSVGGNNFHEFLKMVLHIIQGATENAGHNHIQ